MNKSTISYLKFVLSNITTVVFKILANIINIIPFLLLVAYIFYCNNIKTHIRQECWHFSDSKFAYPNIRFYNLHKTSSVTVCSIFFQSCSSYAAASSAARLWCAGAPCALHAGHCDWAGSMMMMIFGTIKGAYLTQCSCIWQLDVSGWSLCDSGSKRPLLQH